MCYIVNLSIVKCLKKANQKAAQLLILPLLFEHVMEEIYGNFLWNRKTEDFLLMSAFEVFCDSFQ